MSKLVGQLVSMSIFREKLLILKMQQNMGVAGGGKGGGPDASQLSPWQKPTPLPAIPSLKPLPMIFLYRVLWKAAIVSPGQTIPPPTFLAAPSFWKVWQCPKNQKTLKKSLKVGTFFWKNPQIWVPFFFLEKLPLKMGMGPELPAAHHGPIQIWEPPSAMSLQQNVFPADLLSCRPCSLL